LNDENPLRNDELLYNFLLYIIRGNFLETLVYIIIIIILCNINSKIKIIIKSKGKRKYEVMLMAVLFYTLSCHILNTLHIMLNK